MGYQLWRRELESVNPMTMRGGYAELGSGLELVLGCEDLVLVGSLGGLRQLHLQGRLSDLGGLGHLLSSFGRFVFSVLLLKRVGGSGLLISVKFDDFFGFLRFLHFLLLVLRLHIMKGPLLFFNFILNLSFRGRRRLGDGVNGFLGSGFLRGSFFRLVCVLKSFFGGVQALGWPNFVEELVRVRLGQWIWNSA